MSKQKKSNKEKNLNISPTEYRNLLSKIELAEVSLLASSISFTPENLFSDSKILGPARLNIIDETKHSKKGNNFNITSSWKLSAKIEKNDMNFVEIDCSFLVHLICSNDIPEKFWKVYDKSTLPLIVYPYFREFVQNITSRMNIPPLTLPILFQ